MLYRLSHLDCGVLAMFGKCFQKTMAKDNLFSKILSFSNENKLLACFLELRTRVVPSESHLLLAISFYHFLINEQESRARLVMVDSERYSN